MRYFRRVGEGYHAPGDDWVTRRIGWEVNTEGDAERQLEEYANGHVLSYHRTHDQDKYGGLGIMVIDEDEDSWTPYEISCGEFEQMWRMHAPKNRPRATEGQSS